MLTSHELFGFMSPALAAEILGFAFESEKPAYRAALGAVAQVRHLRPVFLERQSRAQRDAMILASLTRPNLEAAAAALIRTWLVKKHAALLEDFLNALDIKNEKGVVDSLPEKVDDARLKAAVDGLLAKHPPEVVIVYLNAFNEMNEAGWENLRTLLQSEPRLQLGAN